MDLVAITVQFLMATHSRRSSATIGTPTGRAPRTSPTIERSQREPARQAPHTPGVCARLVGGSGRSRAPRSRHGRARVPSPLMQRVDADRGQVPLPPCSATTVIGIAQSREVLPSVSWWVSPARSNRTRLVVIHRRWPSAAGGPAHGLLRPTGATAQRRHCTPASARADRRRSG